MNISLANVTRYLRVLGWKRVEHPNHRISLFESPRKQDGDFGSVVLPRDESFADSEQRIREAVRAISDYLQVSVDGVVSTINHWDRDTLKIRIFRRHSSLDALKLPLALTIIDELKSFVGYAAYAEQDPRPHFPRAGSIAADFAEQCLFGHTFEGSFGFRVECPLPSVGQLAFSEELKEAPFERHVVQRIATGYQTIAACAAVGDPGPLLQGYSVGFNANMLRALERIYLKLDTLCVEYAIDWSPELAPIPTLNGFRSLTFDGRAFEVVRYAASELEKENVVEETTIVSHVVALKSEMPLEEGIQDAFEHVITLDWEKERGVFVRIRAVLPTPDYKLACDAHKLGRRIQLRGLPEKQGKFWVLKAPNSLSVNV